MIARAVAVHQIIEWRSASTGQRLDGLVLLREPDARVPPHRGRRAARRTVGARWRSGGALAVVSRSQTERVWLRDTGGWGALALSEGPGGGGGGGGGR